MSNPHPKDHPQGIDTSRVQVPPEIVALTEQLAEHTHNTWARQRLADSWTYGPKRDDVGKEHPCLVPYEQLPESERLYDRTTALEALKAIISLGYRIEKTT